MQTVQLDLKHNPNINFTSLKSIKIKGAKFKQNPAIALKMIDAVKRDNVVMNFCNNWDTKLIISSRKKHFFDLGIDNAAAEIILKYKQIQDKDKLTFFNKLKNYFRPQAEVRMADFGNTEEEASNGLFLKILSNDLEPLLYKSAQKTFDNISFNKKYLKIAGFCFKRKQ